MKTTIDLPEDLLSQVTRRAAEEGRDVNEVIAEILAAGVSSATPLSTNGEPVAKTLPLIKVRPVLPPAGRKLSTQEWCDWVKEADSQLEIERYEKTHGHQHVDRADP